MGNRLEQIEEVFHAAAALPAEERAAYLDGACKGDQALRSEVIELLAEVNSNSSEEVVRAAAEQALYEEEALPERIGEFVIRGVLGEGGMGRVYDAEQERPHRRVALKVIRTGLMTRAGLRRFMHEADVLAGLSHPGIARVLQAGSVSDERGRATPYLAMELVRGASISDYVRREKPGVREMVELLARVCDAVQHAHQRGVIHRDLKPGNVMVEDGEAGSETTSTGASTTAVSPAGPQVKVLDFGIAKLVGEEPSPNGATMRTETGQIVGTLAYMSPEQVSGESAAVDTRSDVYSLGVIGYELLGGRAPLEVAGKSIVDAAEMIREKEPARLGLMNAGLRGDVETIIAKAMEKEPGRRYASAGELAADLRRYLNDEAIAARPASTWYQIRKFAKRHRPLAAAVGVGVTAVTAAAVISTIAAVTAVRQRDVARAAQARAEAVRDFLVEDVFAPTRIDDPKGRGPNVRAGDLLRDAADAVEGRFNKDPEVGAEVQSMLGTLLSSAGQFDDAIKQLKAAIETRKRLKGEDFPDVVRDEILLAHMHSNGGKTDELVAMIGPAKERARRVFGPTSYEALSAAQMEASSLLQQNKLKEAVEFLEAEIKAQTGGPQEKSLGYVSLLNLMSAAYRGMARYDEALKWSERTMTWMETAAGLPEVHRIGLRAVHANLLAANGRLEEAQPLMRECLEKEEKFRDPDDPGLAETRAAYASLLSRLGRMDEARGYFQKAIDVQNRKFGPGHWEAWRIRRAYYSALLRAQDWKGAEQWLDEEEAIQRPNSDKPPPHSGEMEVRRLRADMFIDRGMNEWAAEILKQVESDAERVLDHQAHKHMFAAIDVMNGRLLARAGKRDEAVARITRGRAVFAGDPSPVYPDMLGTADRELKALGVK